MTHTFPALPLRFYSPYSFAAAPWSLSCPEEPLDPKEAGRRTWSESCMLSNPNVLEFQPTAVKYSSHKFCYMAQLISGPTRKTCCSRQSLAFRDNRKTLRTAYLVANGLLDSCRLPCEQALVDVGAAACNDSIHGNHVARPDQQVRPHGHSVSWNLDTCKNHVHR